MSEAAYGIDRPTNERQPGAGWDWVANPWLLPDTMNWRMVKDKFGNVTYVHGYVDKNGEWHQGTPPGFSTGSGATQGTTETGPGAAGGGDLGTAHTIPETLSPIPQGTDVAGLGLTPEQLGLGGGLAGVGAGSLDITGTLAQSAGGTASEWSKILDKIGGYKGLGQLLLKGWSLYELYKAFTDEPDVPKPGAGGKKGGKGGGGGGKQKYDIPATPPVYQGLNYKPTFLAWQPTNAGAPQFTSGGPSSLYGSPTVAPPPPVKKKKKG